MKRAFIIGLLFVVLISGCVAPTSTAPPPQPTQPAPTESTPTSPDISKIVEDELNKLTPGQILFNPPQEMTIGEKERVEVRIAKGLTENLSKGLRGSGKPQIENISVGTFMKVRLTGDNFDIKPLSNEEQLVSGEGSTQWEYDVIPLESGSQSIELIVTVRIKIPDGEEKRDYPVFERPINVKVNPVYSIRKFTDTNWQWIVTTIIGSGIIGWLVTKWRKSRQKKKSKKAQ